MHFIPLVCVISQRHALLLLGPSTGLGTSTGPSTVIPWEGSVNTDMLQGFNPSVLS